MTPADSLLRDARMYLSRKLNRSLAPPDRVSINVTLRCNLTCTMCTTCYDAPELSCEEIKGIIDQTAAWGVEVFNPLGGEPFMRGDIEEILAYAVRRGFYVTVTTNGTLITERRARAIAAIPSDRLHFNLSLDGDEAASDLVRGAGMWRRAIEGYQRIRAADAEAGNSRRKILSNTILHAANLDRFEAILDEQAALGFDGVQILNLFRAGPDAPKEAAALWFRPRHMETLSALAQALARRAEQQSSVGYRIQNPPADLRQIPDYYRDDLTPLEAPCWAGWKELYINADGAAIMCDGKLDFLAGSFGSIREQTLQQLWRSPALQARRAVVKTCTTPCVQNCYLRRDSDSGRALVATAASMTARRAKRRIASMLPSVEVLPDAILRLELTDVPTTGPRWQTLTASVPEPATPQSWTRLRDRGYLDFGRGFMGFEVVRSVMADLHSARLRFGCLALRWRGEPLLHPELEPILDFLLAEKADGRFERLRIETDGTFLTPSIANKPGIEWVVDLSGASVDLLANAERVVLKVIAADSVDPAALCARFPNFTPAAGRFPTSVARVLWFARSDHDHYLDNAEARTQLARVAAVLGLDAELGEEDRPRRCTAPDRTPTVSWDGKITLCPRDVQLHNRVGEVTSGRLSEVWRSEILTADRAAVSRQGVPARDLCRDCSRPWSPNH
ncbi:MAG: MoaA/NifB/PqqE/SkfB family radical SAM enzyme [Myxococcota bacterium]|jgi:MoaA/NifB/PqqE/SkfB family radical SAM enzyme